MLVCCEWREQLGWLGWWIIQELGSFRLNTRWARVSSTVEAGLEDL